MGNNIKEILFKILMIILLADSNVAFKEDGEGIIELCPQYCICDLYQNANRVNCSGQELTVVNNDFPKTVMVLDLSKNDLTTITDTLFSYLNDLIDLNLSFNAINFINADAFKNLLHLETIDLSYNCLASIDTNVFTSNVVLYSINLEGNKFGNFPNEPLISSKSIALLSVRNTQLSSISKKTFSEMPLLREVDLSDNLLITLNLDTFTEVQNLKFLNLSNNNWKCDEDLSKAVNKLRADGLEVELTTCDISVEFVDKKIFLEPDTLEGDSDVYDICAQLLTNPDSDAKMVKICEFLNLVTENNPQREWLDFSKEKYIYYSLKAVIFFLVGSVCCVLAFLFLIPCILYICGTRYRHNSHESGGHQLMDIVYEFNQQFLEFPI